MNAILRSALCTLMLIACLAKSVLAQEAAAPTTPAAALTGKEATYAELRKSKDRLTQQMADRYFNLVKLQEWSSDKGTKITAKYVSHTPDVKSVKLSIAKGFGSARTMQDVTVPVERLSRTCQSRVKQIATLQGKLDELAAKPATSDTAGTPTAEQGAGERAPRNRAPRTTRGERQSDTPEEPPGETSASAPPAAGPPPTTAATTPDDNPDPLGFGELSAGPAPPGGIDVNLTTGAGPGPPPNEQPADPAAPHAEAKDKWRTDYEAFRASVRIGGSQERPQVDMSALPELKAAMDEVEKWEVTGDVRDDDLKEIAKKFDAVGEFTWEATITDKKPNNNDWTDCLGLPPLPEPLSIGFILDEKNAGDWANLKPGDHVRFVGHFVDAEEGTDLVAYIRLADDQSAGGAAPPQRPRRVR